MANFVRYGLATLGPLAVSGAHFIASLILLRTLAPAEFGLFAFLLVLVQFGFGLSNALIGTPLTVNANQPDYQPHQAHLFFKLNLLLSVVIGAVCAALAWALGANAAASLFGAFAVLAVLRWFLRSYFYALHRPTNVALCDLAYALTLMLGLGLAWKNGLTLTSASLAFCFAAGMAVLLAGGQCLRIQFWDSLSARLTDYASIWRNQSRWTLLGVTTTEATSNGHAWLVTLLAGPAAFAPLAAAALLFRPVNLMATSLTQLERPAMARSLANQDRAGALRILHRFRLAIIGTWLVTAFAAGVLLLGFPSLIFDQAYDLNTVLIAAALQAAIMGLAGWRTPDSTLIQAANRFAPLSKASLWSSLVALPSVAILLIIFDPVLSLIGILIGQGVMAVLITRLINEWSASS